MVHLVNGHGNIEIHNNLDMFLNKKAPDCVIYSEDGTEFKTHKELFCQTKFMRELLKSQSCCGLLEVILPCSKEELGPLINFLNEGKIECNKKIDYLKIIENLNKILGYSDDYIGNFLNQDTISGGISKSEGISSLLTKKEDFLNYNEFQLRGLGVLVQKRTYKNPKKKLPLTNGVFLTVEAGKVVTFFKYGDLIALQYKKKIFDPLIDPEHVCGIFKV